jgi:hypothetical protein
MKRLLYIISALALLPLLAHADGRPGTVTWSDGHTLHGGLLLSPGKDLRIYTTDTTAVSLSLDQVKEIKVKVEKEEMRKGYYFPNPGQATQAETGDVYPVRYLAADIALQDGKTLTGHLLTTMLYCENDDGTQKVPLMAKLTGDDGQKIDDLVYAQDIRFDSAAPASAAVTVDLSEAGFTPTKPPVFFTKPDLTPLPSSPVDAKQAWTVATAHPDQIVFAVEAADGIHVAWPQEPVPPDPQDADVKSLVEAALVNMHDFYDSRTLLGSAIEDDSVYSLVMLKRLGAMVDGGGNPVTNGMIPWRVVLMHFDYDAAGKRVTLLTRATLAVGRAMGNNPVPAVLKQPELLRAISPSP